MKLYIYQGLDNERVPRDITYAIVDNSVTTIKDGAFKSCSHFTSIIMGDNVKRIEIAAFFCCVALQFDFQRRPNILDVHLEVATLSRLCSSPRRSTRLEMGH